MKKLIAITLLVLAQAANAQDAGRRPETAMSPKAMEAYEAKAESKAGEFFSYLELLTDPSANDEMKAQTIAEATKLYQNDAVTIENVFDDKGSVISVKKLLELASNQKKQTSFSITSFHIMKRADTAKRRDWLMTYELLIGKKTLNVSQSFSMILEDKKFGTSTKQVWNTYLGEMRLTK
jgi:hypothetical protein